MVLVVKKTLAVAGAASVLLALTGGIAAPALAAPGDTVVMPDARLKECANASLGQGATDDFTEAQASTITNFMCNDGVADLTGIESFTAMTQLRLDVSTVTDLSPLSALPALTTLSVTKGTVTDLAPLATVPNLKTVTMTDSQVTGFATLLPLAGQLDSLDLMGNPVEDYSAISQFSALTTLNLSPRGKLSLDMLDGVPNLKNLTLLYSGLSDFSALSSRTALQFLGLQAGEITDVSQFATGFPNVTSLFLEANRISDLSPLKDRSFGLLMASQQRLSLPDAVIDTDQTIEVTNKDGSVETPVFSGDTVMLAPDGSGWSLPTAGDHRVSWRAAGTPQFSGFVFQTGLPDSAALTVVAEPTDVTVVEGSDASFTASFSAVIGSTTVTWQSSTDDGGTWTDVPDSATAPAAAATQISGASSAANANALPPVASWGEVSGDQGLPIPVTLGELAPPVPSDEAFPAVELSSTLDLAAVTIDQDGTLFRAVATNDAYDESAMSGSALLTVTEDEDTGGEGNGPGTGPGTGGGSATVKPPSTGGGANLAQTGSMTPGWFAAAAVTLAAAGAVLLGRKLRRQR